MNTALRIGGQGLLLVFTVFFVASCGIFGDKGKALNPAEEAAAAARHAPPNPAASLQAGPPDQVAIYTSLGTAYLQNGHPRAAVRELQEALAQPGKHGDTYNVLGLAYQALGQGKLASESFRHALAEDPSNPQFRNNYGAFLLEQGDYAAAIQELRKAVADPLYSTPEFAWTNLAAAYHRLKEDQKALAAIEKALYFKPGYPPALLLWAQMDWQEGNLRNAFEHLQGVLAQEPDNAEALLLAGQIAKRQGQVARAREFWERCVNASPYSAAGKQAQSELLGLGPTP